MRLSQYGGDQASHGELYWRGVTDAARNQRLLELIHIKPRGKGKTVLVMTPENAIELGLMLIQAAHGAAPPNNYPVVAWRDKGIL